MASTTQTAARSTGTGWQVSDTGPDAYENHLVPRFFAPWAERLTDLVEIGPGETVIDVACGTGIVARTAARRVRSDGTVVGVDINPAMLDAARRFAADVVPTIDWREGDAAALPADDAGFDVALCQQALQFLPDPTVALREMHRVLRPDGRLGLAVLRPVEHNPAYVPLADAMERHLGEEAGEMMRSPFPRWDRDALRDLVSGAGFRGVEVHLDVRAVRYPSPGAFLAQEAASSPMADRFAALDGETRSAIAAELAGDLAGWVDDAGLIFPMATYMLVARA